jgi:hypothetical protein
MKFDIEEFKNLVTPVSITVMDTLHEDPCALLHDLIKYLSGQKVF